jgi:acyl-CoA synthetase (AMP-forming)/AMP-acid ligase II
MSLAPSVICNLYGLTETDSCDFCLRPADQPHGFGTIGLPTNGVMFRVARDGRAVAPSETGELQSRTPFSMLGYLDNPELTDASFDDEMARCTTVPRCLVGKGRSAIQRGKTGATRPAIIWNAGISSSSPPTIEIRGAVATMASRSMIRPKDCFWRRSISHPNVN